MVTSVLGGVEKQNSVSYDSCPQNSSDPVMDKIEIGLLIIQQNLWALAMYHISSKYWVENLRMIFLFPSAPEVKSIILSKGSISG